MLLFVTTGSLDMIPVTPGSPHMRLRRWAFAGNGPELPQLSSRRRRQKGVKAMRDLRPLAEPSTRSLTERTLDAAQDWSAQSTPRGELEATRGLELSDESRSHYFGHRAGLEVANSNSSDHKTLRLTKRFTMVNHDSLSRQNITG